MTDTATLDPRMAALEPFFKAYADNIERYVALQSKVKAADGDRSAAIKSWIDTTTDETAVRMREAIQAATAKLKELAEQAVSDTAVSEDEKKRLAEEYKVATAELKASGKALNDLGKNFGLDITAKLSELGDPFAKKTSAEGSSGSTLPRPSVNVRVTKDGDPKQAWDFPNMSSAAAHVDCPLKDFQELYAKAAGVAHEDISSVKTPQTFTWKNDSVPNSATWTVETTPKQTARGRAATVTTPAAPEAPAEGSSDSLDGMTHPLDA